MTTQDFLTTRQAAAELGISLGTVQQMVENGTLEAWKTVGGHRRIARESLDAYLSKRQQLTPSSSSVRPLDILIAEDTATLQALYKLTMEKWGLPLRLRVVDNAFDGLLQVGQAMPDILICDLTMPGLNSFEMIRRLRSHADLARMDIIVVSSMSRDEITEAGGLPQDVTVYGKPIPFHEIKGFVQARLTTRR